MQIVAIFLLFLNLIFFPYSKAQTEEIVFECIIHNELENNKETFKKIYEKKTLDIFLDKQNSWINDVQYRKWKKKNLNDKKRIEFFFYESKKKYFFEYKTFYNDDKNILESSSEIVFEKFGGILKFIKIYYNINQKVFFTSEVIGTCGVK